MSLEELYNKIRRVPFHNVFTEHMKLNYMSKEEQTQWLKNYGWIREDYIRQLKLAK